jgi:hypothetical protein
MEGDDNEMQAISDKKAQPFPTRHRRPPTACQLKAHPKQDERININEIPKEIFNFAEHRDSLRGSGQIEPMFAGS